MPATASRSRTAARPTSTTRTRTTRSIGWGSRISRSELDRGRARRGGRGRVVGPGPAGRCAARGRQRRGIRMLTRVPACGPGGPRGQGRPPVLMAAGSWYFRTGSGLPSTAPEPSTIGSRGRSRQRRARPTRCAPSSIGGLGDGVARRGADAVAAGVLGVVQAAVGHRDAASSRTGRRAGRSRCPSSRRSGTAPRPSGDERRVAERGEDPLGDARRVLAVGLGEDQRELVAAVAGRDVRGAQRADRISSATWTSTPSPYTWPKRVVDELEVVEVEHHDAQRPARPRRRARPPRPAARGGSGG